MAAKIRALAQEARLSEIAEDLLAQRAARVWLNRIGRTAPDACSLAAVEIIGSALVFRGELQYLLPRTGEASLSGDSTELARHLAVMCAEAGWYLAGGQ
jgi:hypothetical protein